MLNGDAHYSTLEDELRMDRCEFQECYVCQDPVCR